MSSVRPALPALVASVIACLIVSLSFAGDLDRISESAGFDLETTLEELAELREQIAAEKLPLARRISQLEEEVAEKRREHDRLRRLGETREADLRRMRTEVDRRRDTLAYFQNLLDDYLETLEARLHIAELSDFRDALREAREIRPDGDRTSRLDGQFDLLLRASERLRDNTGGRLFPGRALQADGTLGPGTFALVGPVGVFQGDEAGHRGLVVSRPDSLRPSLFPLSPRFGEDIRELIETGQGHLPVDTTGGLAIRRDEARVNLWEHIRQGGPVMIPILLLALVAATVALYKWREIAAMPPLPPGELQRILEPFNRGNRDEALKRARNAPGPVGEMLGDAIAHADEGKDLMEEVMFEKRLRTQPKLDRLMPLIALTAATAPLLGLLGTVTGMIQTFQLITLFGTGDAQTLSGGISEALVTTQFGLMVAVPALIVHALLSRKSKGVLSSMEQASIGFINGVSHRNSGDRD